MRLAIAVLALVVTACGPSTRRDEPSAASLESQMYVVVATCDALGAFGTVRNDSRITVDVYIEVNYLDKSGRVLGDGIDDVRGVRPGETANWSSKFLDDGAAASCRASVSSAFEQD